jgi:hypothetical protein
MFLARYSHYVYLLMATVLVVAMVVESGRPDRLNLWVYGIAVVLAVAMFEFRRRQNRRLHDDTPSKDKPDAT